MDNIQDFLNTIAAGQDTKPSDVVVPSSTQNDTSQYLSHGQNTWNYEHRGNNSSSESNQWFPKLLSFDCHSTKNEPRNAVISAFLGSCTLFELQTDGMPYKWKSLILRHFQELSTTKIYMQKYKKCNKNAIEVHSDFIR